jgi:hypothetical protein
VPDCAELCRVTDGKRCKLRTADRTLATRAVGSRARRNRCARGTTRGTKHPFRCVRAVACRPRKASCRAKCAERRRRDIIEGLVGLQARGGSSPLPAHRMPCFRRALAFLAPARESHCSWDPRPVPVNPLTAGHGPGSRWRGVRRVSHPGNDAVLDADVGGDDLGVRPHTAQNRSAPMAGAFRSLGGQPLGRRRGRLRDVRG